MTQAYITFSDDELFVLIRDQDDEDAFGELYERYFRPIFNHVYSKVNDEFASQEIVQDLFVSLWQQRYQIAIRTCRPYLFSMAKNLIISYYRKEFTRQRHYRTWETQTKLYSEQTDQEILTVDLQNHLEQGLHLLPPKCKEVFILSRNGHSNREIASRLAISEKTVEQHITKALRVLKVYLKEHFSYALLFLQIF